MPPLPTEAGGVRGVPVPGLRSGVLRWVRRGRNGRPTGGFGQVAAALEAWLDSCPVCTGAVGDGDQVGVIAGPADDRQDVDK